MTRSKWYSPQLSREIVSRLYYQAKSERIPMTVFANQIIERALGVSETTAMFKLGENNAADRTSK
jgi:hypothetical protein